MLQEILLQFLSAFVGVLTALFVYILRSKEKAKTEKKTSEKLDELGSVLKESSSLIEQMEKEIDEKRRRAKELEGLLERLNSVVSLKEEQVSAIRNEIDSLLKRNAWRNRIWTMLLGAIWFVLGLIVRGFLGF